MRDSQYKSCAVQNQFTAYLIAAIRNYKRTYLRRISTAMQGLSERERYIFLSKVLGEMSLSEIALSLGITYGAAAMSYHRTVLRLRNAVGGGKGE